MHDAELRRQGRNASGSARVAGRKLQEDFMAIPNESVTRNEIEEKRRQEAREEQQEERQRKVESVLDKGLEDTFPASDPPSITQPPPKPKR
jgi:hypothetical protein